MPLKVSGCMVDMDGGLLQYMWSSSAPCLECSEDYSTALHATESMYNLIYSGGACQMQIRVELEKQSYIL